MPTTSIDNIRINYIRSGKGRPCIFLHGIFCAAEGYKEMIGILSKSYTVYAVDLPMHGESEKPKVYLSISDISDLLKLFVDKLAIIDPVIIAHSAGALIAIDYASRNKVKELILIDPAGAKYRGSRLMLLVRLFFWKTLLNLMRSPVKSFVKAKIGTRNFFRNIFNKYYWQLVQDNLKKDYSDQMSKIKCPTKILWGRHDELFPIECAVEFQKRIDNSNLIFINGSHDWPIFNPEKIEGYI